MTGRHAGHGARHPVAFTAALAATVLGAAVLAGGAAIGGYAVTAQVHHGASSSPTPSASSSIAAIGAATVAPTTPSAPAAPPLAAANVAAALKPLVGNADLGTHLTASVIDAASGRAVYDRQAAAAVAPASTAKLLTAAATLTAYQPTDRFTTTVVAGPGTAVTLVGGGDPTLTSARAGQPGYYRGAARISDLAAAIRRAGLRPSRVFVDGGLFTGASVSPYWAPEDVPSSYGAPITALMVDGGRDSSTASIDSSAPDLAAGRALAAALGTPSAPVARAGAPAGARPLGSVRSAPVSVLVTEMLQLSDNIIAEVLGRQVALHQHLPASFAGGAQATRAVVRSLGVDPGAGMVDASGLAPRDRLSATTLASVLRVAVGTAHPALHDLVAGLPVAGWSGTLDDRYLTGSARAGAGVVRAKTGTLTGVSTLAGVARDASGGLVVFAFMTDRAPSTPAADAALDQLAAGLARCGCS